MPAEYPGEMRIEAIKSQEPEVETQIRDTSPASSGAVPIGQADTVNAVCGPSDSRHKELRDIFRRATDTTKMGRYAEKRKKSKPIVGTDDPLPIVPGVPKSWRGRTQEDSSPNGLFKVADERPRLPFWIPILK